MLRTTVHLPPTTQVKLLDRVVHEQTMEFLDKHNILYQFQSTFWKNYSTDFCLSYLTDKIYGFDSGLLTGVILNDLEKEFDIIDQNILLLKMPSLGFSLKLLIGISHTYPVGNSLQMFMTNSLPLTIYDAEFQKNTSLDLCYFCCI